MEADPNSDPNATRSASPSGTEPTRASVPTPGTLPSSAAAQVRDPHRYLIIGEHGRGGLGRVSRAHDRDLGRDVAIKELLSRGNVSEVRFLREALITARLEHPGIVPVHEAGRWPDGTPFYAMKLVAGRPLRDLIAERTTVDERIGLLHHVIAVADAIAYAHGRNIIHRDLKPANVIVGDFGETIVIDWGLAKDLSTNEAVTTDGGRFRSNRNESLTSDGSVLGTPAYMPPEQERGEHVDQRADVFAIGAMLWELCSLQKVPPTERNLRHRLLRHGAIDRDLSTIIDKALDPDPARRYPDAGALAADLKAFKSGARIAARSYSLWALLTHWTRRHRVFTLSAMVAVVLATAVGVLYVRNVAAARDRSDTALARAESAQNDLVLAHAALQLHSDPTAAVDTLSGYGGSNSARRMQLLAEAYGQGVAHITIRPHNDTIWFLTGQPDGSLISIGEDHRVRRTVGTTTTTLATNVSYSVRTAYSPSRRLLAYSTSPSGVALMDLTSTKAVTLKVDSPISIGFTPDGSSLATLEKGGTLTIWSTSSAPVELYRETFPDAITLDFSQISRLLLVEKSKLRSVNVQTAKSITWNTEPTAIAATELNVVAGFADGTLKIFSNSLDLLATTRACKQRVSLVTIVPRRQLIAVGCEEGLLKIVRTSGPEHTLSVLDTVDIETEPSRLISDNNGTNIFAASDQATSERTTYVYNIEMQLTRRLEGQSNIINAISAPSTGFPYLAVGDVNGTVRLWNPPTFNAKTLTKVPATPLGARFSPDSAVLAIFGTDPTIRLFNLTNDSTLDLKGHTGIIGGVRFSPDGHFLMSFSRDGTVRTWRASDGMQLRAFTDHRSIVEDGSFTKDGEYVVSIGDDGHLFAWHPDGQDTRTLLTHVGPLLSLEVLSTTNDIVVRDSAGALWVVDLRGSVKQVQQGTSVAATSMRASRDGTLLALGREDGSVTLYRTADWTILNSFAMSGTIARIVFDPQNRDLLVQSEDGFVRLIPLAARRSVSWQDFHVEAHDIAYDPSGDVLAISAVDGGSWFYSIRRDTWSYQQDHMTELMHGRFSPNGAHFVSIDRTGGVVIRDTFTVFK
jgi:WD40 repeat protein